MPLVKPALTRPLVLAGLSLPLVHRLRCRRRLAAMCRTVSASIERLIDRSLLPTMPTMHTCRNTFRLWIHHTCCYQVQGSRRQTPDHALGQSATRRNGGISSDCRHQVNLRHRGQAQPAPTPTVTQSATACGSEYHTQESGRATRTRDHYQLPIRLVEFRPPDQG